MTSLLIENFNSQELRELLREIIKEELASLKEYPKTNSPPFNSSTELLLSQQQAAKLLKISIPTFRKMIQEKKIKPIKVGKRNRFKSADLIK